MDGSSLNIIQEQISKLKSIFPEVTSEVKIDWERLRLTLGEDVFKSNERYVLNWAGKSDAFRTLQTGTTTTLAPTKEESINLEYIKIRDHDHILIYGETGVEKEVLAKTNFFMIPP